MRRTGQHDAGFSLLETLLGLTLTAMIGVLMMGSLQLGARVWERQETSEMPGEEQLVLSQVSEWLAQAMPAKPRSLDEPHQAPFFGDAKRVSFLHAAPGLGASPGVYAIDLALVDASTCAGKLDLILRASRLRPADQPDPDDTAPPQQRKLASCIASPSFVFWGRQADQAVAGWHEGWALQTGLPAIVRLRSVSPEGFESVLLAQRLLAAPN